MAVAGEGWGAKTSRKFGHHLVGSVIILRRDALGEVASEPCITGKMCCQRKRGLGQESKDLSLPLAAHVANYASFV